MTPADTDTIPFLSAVEVKYYHYPVSRYGRKAPEEVKRAYEMLKIMKREGLTHEIALVIGDHYYHRSRANISEKLQQFSESHRDDVIYLKI